MYKGLVRYCERFDRVQLNKTDNVRSYHNFKDQVIKFGSDIHQTSLILQHSEGWIICLWSLI